MSSEIASNDTTSDRPKLGRLARDASTVMVGTAISQGIMLLSLAVLARVYTPADFGIWAIFQSATALLTVIATLRFDLVIYMGKTDEDAAEAMLLVLLSGVAVGVTIVPFIALFGGMIGRTWGGAGVAPLLWLLCPHAVVVGAGVALLSWWARNHQFKHNAAYRITLNAVTVAIQFGLSWFSFSTRGLGLILGTAGGQWLVTIAGLLVVVLGNRELFLRRWRIPKLLGLAWRYRKFPLFTLPNSLLEQGYIQVVTLLLGAWFSAAVVGNFYLALRLSYTPFNFLSGAIGQAFLPQMARIAPNIRPLSSAIARLLRLLLLVMVPAIVGVATYGTSILTTVLGARWAEVGPFATYMVLAYAFAALFSWMGQIFDIIQRQSINLILGIVLQAVVFCALFAGYYLTHQPVQTVAFFSIALFFLDIVWFLVAVRVANLEMQVVSKPLSAGILSGLGLCAAAFLSDVVVGREFGFNVGMYAFVAVVALYYAILAVALRRGTL